MHIGSFLFGLFFYHHFGAFIHCQFVYGQQVCSALPKDLLKGCHGAFLTDNAGIRQKGAQHGHIGCAAIAHGDSGIVAGDVTLFDVIPRGFGIDQRRTVAIGDYDNDVGMLREAGVGVAVSNASHAAMAAADVVLPVSNDEHAIAALIHDIEIGKIDLTI